MLFFRRCEGDPGERDQGGIPRAQAAWDSLVALMDSQVPGPGLGYGATLDACAFYLLKLIIMEKLAR